MPQNPYIEIAMLRRALRLACKALAQGNGNQEMLLYVQYLKEARKATKKGDAKRESCEH